MFDYSTLNFDYTTLKYFLYGIAIEAVCFFIGYKTINSYYNYYKLCYNKDEDEEEIDTRNPSEIYCDNYWKEYKDLEYKDNDKEKIADSEPAVDELPFYGDTMIKYSNELNGYYYYNDRGAHIPYKMLATLARKFVVQNDCKSLYVNIDNELMINNVMYAYNINNAIIKDKKMESDVFVRKDKSKRYIDIANDLLIKGNYIKFKYKGKLKDSDSDSVNVVPLEPEENKAKKIDFATFKKLNS